MELNVGEWAVLGVLAERPRHGFAVAAELAPGTELGEVWAVRRPLVYRAIDRLVAGRYVRLGRAEPGAAGPPRRMLAVTARGRRSLEAWLDAPVAHLRDVRSELLLKLLLRERLGLPLGPLVHAQQARFAPLLAALQADDGSVVARWRHESALAVERFLAGLA